MISHENYVWNKEKQESNYLYFPLILILEPCIKLHSGVFEVAIFGV